MTDFVKQGKRNRANGAEFERRVRKDLEDKGWIVSKWANNVKDGKCVPAKPGKFRMMQTGFPDFITYKRVSWTDENPKIVFVEVKTNGYLSKEEKAKAKWYLDNNYCSKFLIASKSKVNNRVVITYNEFK
jgi:hypothetical protein